MSESIGAAAGELLRIADAAPSGAVAGLGDAIERVRDQLGELIGTEHELTEHAGQLAAATASVFRDLVALRQALRATADHHLGSSGPAPPSAPSAGSAAPAASPPPVRAADGSEYPAAAAWAVREGLPPRVRADTGTPTTGYVHINGIPMRMQSGDDPYSDMVDERLRDLGVRRPGTLRRHVEMKAAAMLARSGDQHQEIVINHAPCGSEPAATRGCHAILEPFLPAGRSLTVHGTTADGAPFTHTYRGRGS